MVRGRRYRGAIPEARTKEEAENVLTRIRRDAYERKFDRVAKANQSFVKYVNNTYLPWARANKQSWEDDVLHTKAICEFFALKLSMKSTAEWLRGSRTNGGIQSRDGAPRAVRQR